MLSVNQMNAQIKLLDMWKATNTVDYPTKVQKMEIKNGANRAMTRSITSGKLKEIGSTCLAKDTFYNDIWVKAWNAAHGVLKSCTFNLVCQETNKDFC